MMTLSIPSPSVFSRRVLLPLLLTTLMLGGCKEESASPVAENAQPATTETAPKAEQGFQVVDEIYGDPEIFAQPRIQFTWRSPNNLEQREIWSINLDGSDLRRAVPYELIEGSVWYAVRSPDNRYIAMSVALPESYEKRMVDLKEMKVKTFSEGGNKPAFQWSQDSQTVYFNEDGLFKQYHLPSDEVIEITRFGMGGNNFLLFDNDRKIVLFKPTAYTINRMSDGQELRRVDMPKGWVIDDDRVAMSVDEQYIYYDTRESRVDSLVNPEERYGMERTRPSFFSPIEPNVMFFGLAGRRNFVTGERFFDEFPLPKGGGNQAQLTLINTRIVEGGER